MDVLEGTGAKVPVAMRLPSRVFCRLTVYKKKQVLALQKFQYRLNAPGGFTPAAMVPPFAIGRTGTTSSSPSAGRYGGTGTVPSFIISYFVFHIITKIFPQTPCVKANTPITREFTDPAFSGRYTMHGMPGQGTPGTACHRNLPPPDI
jgi:hypothetical protein